MRKVYLYECFYPKVTTSLMQQIPHITSEPNLHIMGNISFEFEQDIRDGYYDRVKMCLSLKSLIKVLEMFPNHRAELIDMFNYSMSELVDENLWK